VSELLAYSGLLASAFLAATILPAQSEGVLVGMLLTGRFETWLLLSVASIGNTLGSVVNWLIGRFASRVGRRWWMPASRDKLAKAEAWYHRYGRWTLLLSWVPIVGDPLTIVAGALREPIASFILIVGLAKTARYLVLAAATLGWT
jgi:membrane protein YqaA with SNARE-associated domain